MALDLALVVFDTLEGAELAFAQARERAADEPWVAEVAFVEHHAHDRIVMRGVIAGRYVDVDELGDVVGRDAAIGALTGALVGALLGPPGFAVGLVGGAAAGGYLESIWHSTDPRGELFELFRREVPKGGSAVVLLAAPEHVDSMTRAFEGLGGRLKRLSLPDEAVDALLTAVQGAPPAATRR
jgi:uncharacterized membrane protein